METINILLLVSGWLLISFAIARVVGGASDIGETPGERCNELLVVGASPGLSSEEDCLGLVLERVATPPVAYFPAFLLLLATHRRSAIPPASAYAVPPLQVAPQDLATPDIRLPVAG